jgi:acyl-CoA thioester hydrolase
VSAGRIGTTSFGLAMALRVLASDAPGATAETTYVLVREREQTKCELPEGLRQRLLAGAPGLVIDHAGAHAGVASCGST